MSTSSDPVSVPRARLRSDTSQLCLGPGPRFHIIDKETSRLKMPQIGYLSFKTVITSCYQSSSPYRLRDDFAGRQRGWNPPSSPSVRSSEAHVSLHTSEPQQIKQISSTVTVFAMLIFALSSARQYFHAELRVKGEQRGSFSLKTSASVHLICLNPVLLKIHVSLR